MIFGLIGFPLAHSRSPEWFAEKFREEGHTGDEYRLFPLISAAGLPALLREYPGLTGLNVTVPHKTAVIPYLDELDETAALIGAVNTILITRTAGTIRLRGFNTDAPAFLETLSELTVSGPALVLGTGGASRAVTYALGQAGIPLRVVSRNPHGPGILTYEGLTPRIIGDHPLIINATPAGMAPDTGQCPPIPYDELTSGHVLYDLVYNPPETLFMRRGLARGGRAVNGLSMLHKQAELSYRLFTKKNR